MFAKALCVLLLASLSEAIVIDLSLGSGIVDGLRTHLCHVPVLASTSDQMSASKYQFTLARGGTIEGTVEVTWVSKEVTSRAGVNPKDVLEGMDDRILSGKQGRTIQIRKRQNRYKHFQDHYNLYQLVHNIYKWLSGSWKGETKPEENVPANIAIEEKTELDNVYLLLLSKAQYEVYLTSEYWKQTEPSRDKDSFVYNSHIIAELRLPISEVGKPIKFFYRAKENDRFALFIFNADERKLTIKGNVSFMNPGNDHLPVEMKYFPGVMTFWEIVFLLTGTVTLLYLVLLCKGNTKLVNYMLAVNFIIVAVYLQLDRLLLHSIATTGTYSNILWTFVHFLRRLHEIYVLTMLVLLALGWKVLRDQLTEMEYRMLFSICTVSCVAGFIAILVNGIDVSRYAVNTVAFVAILIATNFNAIIIHSRLSEEGLNAQAGMAYSLMRGYGLFRLGFIAYIFKPLCYTTIRGICLQLPTDRIFVWDEHIMLFLDLAFDYALYCLYFYAFRPLSQLPLFKHLLSTHAPNCPARLSAGN